MRNKPRRSAGSTREKAMPPNHHGQSPRYTTLLRPPIAIHQKAV
nr:MAG TPA: hypothetical protein [Caudoviricetes sp.]